MRFGWLARTAFFFGENWSSVVLCLVFKPWYSRSEALFFASFAIFAVKCFVNLGADQY